MTATVSPPNRSTAGAAPETPRFVQRRPIKRLGQGKAVPFGRLFGLVLLLAIWSAGSATGLIDPRKLAAPWSILTTGWELLADGTLMENVLISLQRAIIALVIGVVVGTGLALIAGLSRFGEYLVDGPVQFKRAIPTLGLIPLMILWFGIGETFKIVLITLGVVVHMYMQTHAALTNIDRKLVELAEIQGVGRATFVRRVVLPGSMSGWFLGLRLSFTSAWLALIVVETVNATDGLGKMMSSAQNYGQTDVIMVGLACYALFGLISDAVIRILERRTMRWRRTMAS